MVYPFLPALLLWAWQTTGGEAGLLYTTCPSQIPDYQWEWQWQRRVLPPGSQPKNLAKHEAAVWREHGTRAALRDPLAPEHIFCYRFSEKCHQLLSTYLKPRSLYYTPGCHPYRMERSWKEAATTANCCTAFSMLLNSYRLEERWAKGPPNAAVVLGYSQEQNNPQ